MVETMNGILAISDQWAMGILSLIMGAGMTSVGMKTAQLGGLEKRLEDAINKRIDERFANMGQEMDELMERLRAGDKIFARLNEKAAEVQLSFQRQLDQAKDWVRQQAGSREAQKIIFTKLDGISAQVNRLPCQTMGSCPGGHREVV
jgi:hypothetical protein